MIFLLKAFKMWCITAALLLLLSSFIVAVYAVGSDKLAYISSAVSFVSAAFAGKSAAVHRKGGTVASGLASACFIVLVLLSIGFLFDSRAVSVSGIISVVSFTFSGCLFGSVILAELIKVRTKKRFRIKT